jgi:hypothetical protein
MVGHPVLAWNAGNPKAHLLDGESGELLFTFPNYRGPGLDKPLTGLPDLNGDGRGEILIGAPNATSTSSPRRSQAGQVFLYLSDPRPKPPKPAAVGWSAEGFKLRLTGEPATPTNCTRHRPALHHRRKGQSKCGNC